MCLRNKIFVQVLQVDEFFAFLRLFEKSVKIFALFMLTTATGGNLRIIMR